MTINDRDAPWITPEVKTALRKNKRVFKRWINRGRKPSERAILSQTQCVANKTINNAKRKYLSNLGNTICDPNTGPKCFWTAFNRLVNNKKITNIPPLIENDTYISCFKKKAGIINNFFSMQCRPLVYGSNLPYFTPLTDKFLFNISFDIDIIVTVIINSIAKRLTVLMVFRSQC